MNKETKMTKRHKEQEALRNHLIKEK
jgi:hypothetical protein